MKYAIAIALLAAIVPLRMMSSAFVEAQAASGGAPTWGVLEDRSSGPVLFYRTSDGFDLARLSCVGPSRRMPLLDTARPYNLTLSLGTDLARTWLAGREVFAMVRGVDSWRKVQVMPLQDRLAIGPKETERALIALRETGALKVKVVGNTQAGVVEEEFDLPQDGLDAHFRLQQSGCRDRFSG